MSKALLQFRLLGGHVVQYAGKNITLALPHKGRALLVYLLLTGCAHARKKIANLLWPDAGLDKALRSLRVLLNTLRNKHHLTQFIKTDRSEIEIDSVEEIWCDSIEFQQIISSGNHRDLDLLRSGLDLYLGKFMLGFDATDTPFDDWLYQQQIVLEDKALHGLVTLIFYYESEDNPRAAIEYAYRLVDIDPWREASYRQLMTVLAKSDRADAALFAYENCCQILQEKLGLSPENETISLAEQIRQHKIQVIQPSPAPHPAISSDVPFLAPMIRGPFVGREQIMDRLLSVLKDENGRSRTCLTGMGGIGKTTIAMQLAHQLKNYFPDGVLWADAAQQEPMTIVDQWATAYGYDLHHVKNEQERMLALRSILDKKQALIVVDDVSRAAGIRPLLPESGQCKLLFTSRNVGVARLLDAQPVWLDGLSAENGRSLFAHFIPAPRAAREPKAFETICELLHNLPLAIVIAGNYLLERQHMRLADFVEQLETATQKIDIRNANRQVRASFDISWDALHDEEKQWFRILGVFNGRHFSAEAFAAIAKLNFLKAGAQLQNLVELSLLNRMENGRFRQHPLLAEFANEKLSKQDPAFQHTIDYYLNFAIANQKNYSRLHPEWENLNAGIQIAYQHHKWSEIAEFANALHSPWFARGRYSDARAAFSYASDAAMYLEDEKEYANVHFRWGQASLEQSDYVQAQEKFEESLKIYEEGNDKPGIGNVHYELSRIAINQGSYEKADSLLASSHQIRHDLADSSGLAEIFFQQARSFHRQGNYSAANQLCQDALLLHEETNNSLGEIRVLRLLTSITTMMQAFSPALNYAERALKLAEEIEDAGEVAMAYYSLSIAHHNLQDIKKALTFADESLNRLKQIGDINAQAQVIFHKCLVYKDASKYELALAKANEALSHFQKLNDQFYTVLTLGHGGDCLKELDQVQAARKNWTHALTIAESMQDQRLMTALSNRLQAN